MIKSSESLTVPPMHRLLLLPDSAPEQQGHNKALEKRSLMAGDATFVPQICLKFTGTKEQESDLQFPVEQGVSGTWEHPAF